MTEYNPDSWVVLRMVHKDNVVYKVLGGFAGGYLEGSSWRLNSGIEKAVFDSNKNKWNFYGSSGSLYICHPDGYRLSMSTYPIYQTMIETYPDQIKLLEKQNWEEMDWTK